MSRYRAATTAASDELLTVTSEDPVPKALPQVKLDVADGSLRIYLEAGGSNGSRTSVGGRPSRRRSTGGAGARVAETQKKGSARRGARSSKADGRALAGRPAQTQPSTLDGTTQQPLVKGPGEILWKV
jgi:hypothetical protein